MSIKIKPAPQAEALTQLFENVMRAEGVADDAFEIQTYSVERSDRFVVEIIWDGFQNMSLTSRQVWIWDRFRKAEPDIAKRQEVFMLRALTVPEYVTENQ